MYRFLITALFVLAPLLLLKGDNLTPSEKIDQLVGAALKKQKIKPNGEITDDVFLRRIYLNIAGRVPTIEEAEAFYADDYPNKREQLIDKLLNSEAYVSTFYHFWADLLRLNGEPGGAVGNAYQLWVKNAIRENLPYNQMVYELVTAEGKIWDNGAVGYYMRDRGMRSIICRTRCGFFWEPGSNAPNATIIPSINGPRWTTSKWHRSAME